MRNTGGSSLDDVRALLASVFIIPVSSLSLDSTPDNTPQWDSLSHLTLITELEQHYTISIPHEDAVNLLSVVEIQQYHEGKKLEFSNE